MFDPPAHTALTAATGLKFQQAAQHLDAFQYNFIAQLPGQTVAQHLDAPYFIGRSRAATPQWLLVVMVFSGLFEEFLVPQVQVVGYLHEWQPSSSRAGQFVHWADSQPSIVPPAPLAGSAIDGSRTVHAAVTYRPGRPAPLMDKSKAHSLYYRDGGAQGGQEGGSEGDGGVGRGQPAGSAAWELRTDGQPVANFTDDDLRVAIVYRARCFADEAAQAAFEAAGADSLPLDTILGTLAADLAARGVLSAEKAADWRAIPRLELGLLLLDTFIRYPLPQEPLIPFNYCMLPRAPNLWARWAASWLEPLLVLLCD